MYQPINPLTPQGHHKKQEINSPNAYIKATRWEINMTWQGEMHLSISTWWDIFLYRQSDYHFFSILSLAAL